LMAVGAAITITNPFINNLFWNFSFYTHKPPLDITISCLRLWFASKTIG
jgi:hypothetical protein